MADAYQLRQLEKAMAHIGDVWRRLAAQKNGVPESEATPTMRRIAKEEAYRSLYSATSSVLAGFSQFSAVSQTVSEAMKRHVAAQVSASGDFSALEMRILAQTVAGGALTAEELYCALAAASGETLKVTAGPPMFHKAERSKAQWKRELRGRSAGR